jgi:hypothetical protein
MYVNHVQRSEEFKQPSRDEFSEWRCHAVAREQHVQREDSNSLYIFSPINVRIKLAVRLAPRIKPKKPFGLHTCTMLVWDVYDDEYQQREVGVLNV